jgi:hypothetical protein
MTRIQRRGFMSRGEGRRWREKRGKDQGRLWKDMETEQEEEEEEQQQQHHHHQKHICNPGDEEGIRKTGSLHKCYFKRKSERS